MSQTKCPHCGFLNFAISAYCGRCERPLRVETPQTVGPNTPPQGVPIRSMPPRAPKLQLVPPPSRPTAPLPPEALKTDVRTPTPAEAAVHEAPTVVVRRDAIEGTSGAPKPENKPKATPGSLFQRLTPKALLPEDTVPESAAELGPEPAEAPLPQEAREPRFAESLREEAPEEPAPAAPPRTTEPRRTAGFENAATTMTPGAPQFWRVALAALLDGALVASVGLALAACEMLVFDVRWPSEGTGLDALAMWVHIYPHTAVRAIIGMTFFAYFYSVGGAYVGRTLGRALLGLRLVRNQGQRVSWPIAALRGVLSVASVWLFGAGYFWMVVDNQHRTWADLLSRAVVVRR